jgi:hypothetical protein
MAQPPVPPAAIPAQPGANPNPATPGPIPTPIQRPVPRIPAGGPINLPPGYSLPPGWAVIPAHNVQIIPPATHPLAVMAPATALVAQQQGPPPGSATSPGGGTGDVTIPNNNYQLPPPPSGQAAAAPAQPPPQSPTNTNTPTSTINSQNLNLSNMMQQRTTGARLLASQSPHPSFPISIPLAPPVLWNAGGIGQQRPASSVPTRTNGMAETPTQLSPRMSGTTNPSAENDTNLDERFAILSQMNDSVRAMQDLLARMQSLAQPPPTPTATTTVSPRIETSHITLPSPPPSTSTTLQPPSPDGYTPETSSPSRSPPGSPVYRRRSMSPLGRRGEDDPHPADRLHRLSSSDEEFSPEELADIKAPWVEHPLDDELPLPEVRTSRQNSPPRLMRSSLESPIHQLRRRGSLLRHEITEEILDDERGRDQNRTLRNLELENTFVGSEGESLNKGKGKAVSAEDEADD